MVFAKNFARFYEKQIILGASDAWSMSCLSHWSSEPAYYIVDWLILWCTRLRHFAKFGLLSCRLLYKRRAVQRVRPTSHRVWSGRKKITQFVLNFSSKLSWRLSLKPCTYLYPWILCESWDNSCWQSRI